MSLITWTQEEFGTTVAKHDEEHKHLFTLLNHLHECVGGSDREAVGKALDGLIAYVAEHFASEEANLKAAAYPAFEQHKAEHDSLVATCVGLQKDFHAGKADIDAQTTGFLKDWLYKHIPQVDRKYGPALSGR